MDPGIHKLVSERLASDGAEEDAWGVLVLAALGGPESLEGRLRGDEPARAAAADAPSSAPPPGAFLRAITVEGFRGIGPERTLEIRPGPGLTLVVGRNGSGKSSFAEGLEVLLTGDSLRWKERAAVWREGWRNLHHQGAALGGTFVVEGAGQPWEVRRSWEPEAAFEAASSGVEAPGRPAADLKAMGWSDALRTHRPFLSYNELGSLLDEGPSKLYDALSSILGLEDLVAAQAALQEARRSREKVSKDATDSLAPLLDRLRGVDDERARRVVAALEGKSWDLPAVEGVLGGAAASSGGGDVEALRAIASLEPPDEGRVAAAVAEMRSAAAAEKAALGTAAAKARDTAALLDQALRHHAAHGDGDCPVCGSKGAFDKAWDKKTREAAARLRDSAKEADAVNARAEAARRQWETLAALRPEALQKAAEVGLDFAPLLEALGVWVKAQAIADLTALADHVEKASGPLRKAVDGLREGARKELTHKEGVWSPAAADVAAWLSGAREAATAAPDVKRLKAAEAWLKKAAAGIRDDRFAPIAEKAAAIWDHLRQESHVALGRIQLTGDGTRRRVVLDVTVDGVEGAALGVMSQGELHSLALSLFVPRATLPESPFRFIVIDDPVQSMDPARIDGLARVLQGASADRQVVVFTHDDRLPEAVRRLDIAAEIVEVTRRDASVVEVRKALDPVGRYLEDAFAVASAGDLPAAAASRVVPGLCRLALEAACMEVVRRRRLGRGEPYSDVERALTEATGLGRLLALALYDDAGRAADVPKRLEKEAGGPAADAFRQCEESTPETRPNDAVELVRRASHLAGFLRGLR